MTAKTPPWFGRVLKWHKMAHGHACAYRGRVYTIVKLDGEKRWHFTVNPDDPTCEPLTAHGGPELARTLESSRLLAEVRLLVDPADRIVGRAPNFTLAVAGSRPVFRGGSGKTLVAWVDAEHGLLRICRDTLGSPDRDPELPGPLVATVQPIFHHGGQITHWRIAGPDGAHWDNSAYWREACRLIAARV
ncbi:hypothetical protein [Nocardia wallacei]|uniref:hypothetical protein n=1 Tax=Nocardia wallacei TaxID=480035 RepID=UPI002455EF6B|nr:hypothetical protein [Nocardia wallacei]